MSLVYTLGILTNILNMKTQINLKIDPIVKIGAQKKAKALGLSLSSVVNASLKQFSKTGELHLSTNYRMTPYLETIITEAKKEYGSGKFHGPFDSPEKMIKNLKS